MPVAPERRDSDSPDENHIPRRDGTGELRLAWGNWSIGVRGPFVVSVLLLLALGAGIFYTNVLNIQAHGSIERSIYMTSCTQSLTDGEKVALREMARRNPLEWREQLYYLCPYVRPSVTSSLGLTDAAVAATIRPGVLDPKPDPRGDRP